MAIEIGKELSPEMSGLLRSSLTGKDITKVAAKFDESYGTVKSIIYSQKAVSENTYELTLEILKFAIDVNKIEITKRWTMNNEIRNISKLAEQAA